MQISNYEFISFQISHTTHIQLQLQTIISVCTGVVIAYEIEKSRNWFAIIIRQQVRFREWRKLKKYWWESHSNYCSLVLSKYTLCSSTTENTKNRLTI